MKYNLSFVILANRIKIEEEKIETIKKWPELKSVKNIQVFLSFANFDKRFIKNFNRIVVLLISMLQSTKIAENEALSILINKHEKNQDIPSGVSNTNDDNISENIENLSTIIKSAKSKKSNLNKFKNQIWLNPKRRIYRIIVQKSQPKWIFLFLELKKFSYT